MITIDEAKAIMKAGLGKAELEFVTTLTAPLFWVYRDGAGFRARNGSAFFLDTGSGPFGVTANQVIEGLRKDVAERGVVAVQIGASSRGDSLLFDLNGKNEIIAAHAGIDIATFRITIEEIKQIGHQKAWPTAPPQRDRGIYYSGFPGVETLWLSANEASFGACPGSGVASSISDVNVSSLIERENLIAVLGNGLPPEDYDFRGMSGGPMLTVVEHNGIRSWRLAGILYRGPNPVDEDGVPAIAGLEIMTARRADFILPDGHLDIGRWDDLNLSSGGAR
jgi:hypothetical protein